MAKLERTLSLGNALAIGLGTMLGAGVFVLTGMAAQAAGPAAIFSFGLAGVGVLMTALCFSELASALPKAGGPYAFVREAFSPELAFIVGWSLWVGLALTTTFYAIGFAQYVSFLFPVSINGAAFFLAVAVISVNVAGNSMFIRLQNVVVIALVAILGIYVIRGWFGIDPTLHAPFFPYGWPPVIRMASVLFVSFLGFELVATAAEEIKNPRVNLPLATVGSVVVVTGIYMLMLFITTGIQGYDELGRSTAPIADTAMLLMGPVGGWLMVVAGMLATISSANGSIMAASRVLFAMARDGMLPSTLSDITTTTNSPAKSMVVTGVIVFIAIFHGDVEWLAEAAGFLHLYPFILVSLATLKLREKHWYQPRFRVPGGPLVPVLGMLSCMVLISQLHVADMITSLMLLLPGLLFYGLSCYIRLRPI